MESHEYGKLDKGSEPLPKVGCSSVPSVRKSSPSPRIGAKRKGSVPSNLSSLASSLEEEVRECCAAILAPCWGAVDAEGVNPIQALASTAKGLGIQVPDEADEEEIRFLLVEYVIGEGGTREAAEAAVEYVSSKTLEGLEDRNKRLASGLQAQQVRFGLLLHALDDVRYQVLNGLVRPLGKASTRKVLGPADARQGWLDGILCREGASIDDLREYAKVLAARRDSLQDRAKVAKTLEGACSLNQRAQDTILLLGEVYDRIDAIKKGEDRIPRADQELTVQDLVDRLSVQDIF